MHDSVQTASSDTKPASARYLAISRSGETLSNPDGTVHYLGAVPEALGGGETPSEGDAPSQAQATGSALLARTVLRPSPVLDATAGGNTARDAAENTDEKTYQVHALYCEDETLQAIAATLQEAGEEVRVSTNGFRYYPVHADPLGRARYAAALAWRDYLIEMRYSAYTGEEAPLGRKGIRRTVEGEMVFPRIEPAVMALVISREGQQILLANNRQWHPNRFALIAGFVDPGENLEEATAREVYEETGLRVLRSEYRMSDVWPFPRSLMICYRVTVDEREPIVHHDGEIRSARWFTAPALREAIALSEQRGNSGQDDPAKLELPGTNAVARRMIDDWLAEKP